VFAWWWWLVFPPFAFIEGRFLYEQTWLTFINGPQNIGFAMAHQAVLLLLVGLAGMLGTIFWTCWGLLLSSGGRYRFSALVKVQFALAYTTLTLSVTPIGRFVLWLS
jgi:hypothetical protein